MRRSLSVLAVLVSITFLPIGSLTVAQCGESNIEAFVPAQKIVAISKISAKTSAAAILIAEKKHKGWKVVKIKEHKKHWGITMKKK